MNLKNMWKKHTPEIETKEPHFVNGMPWPRLPEGEYDKVPLQEEYRHYSMDYLDSDEAKPIFEAQADYIMKFGHKTIVDIGCRHGPVNDILYERGYIDEDYRYFGFDTSTESIEYAQKVWEEFPGIEYKVGTYKFIDDIFASDATPNVEVAYQVDYKVDCLIWSGVLLYEPQQHQRYFQDIQQAYGARHAIIQEPMKDQRVWRDGLELNTIANKVQLHYKNKYHAYEDLVTDCDIFSGRRLIAHITCYRSEGRRSRTWTEKDIHGILCGPQYNKLPIEEWDRIPPIRYLPKGEKVVPYIWRGKVNPKLTYKELELCANAFKLMEKERHNHRLADNYSEKGLHLDKMWIYNIVFGPLLKHKRYKHDVRGKEIYHRQLPPMFASGVQEHGKAARIFSRYFEFDQYKTDGSTLLDKVDDWEELKYVFELLGYFQEHKVAYWSRDKSPLFFHKLLKELPHIFGVQEDIKDSTSWQVHPEKLEIIYPNNKQYIFYNGDLNEVLYNGD